ncbi:MAG: NAD-dependent succinate-semialdehyde dehydrogenase [Gammaproteobacteria bacterium]|jgi:succinate-semialdehyde dehydrogenase/glutarate-semialdehyde dehydrogenase
MGIESRNPATEELIEAFDALPNDAVDGAIGRSVAAHQHLRSLSLDERALWMREAARLLEERKQRYGRLLTEEMGKTLSSAIAEVEKCAWVCRYYADNAAAQLANRPIETDAARAYACYLPLGPVLAVMPWNFPFWQVFRFAAPALMAGNTGLLKHASNVPRSALAIADVFTDAGFPSGCFQTLLIGADQVERVVADPRVRAVTLTGSEGAGTAIAAAAGNHIKKTVLELGGSDPFIVMPSADLDKAVETAVTARTMNNGQSCIAAKRFIVHRDIYPRFRDAFVAAFEALELGDPMLASTDVGPLATAAVRNDLATQVSDTLKAGALRLCGVDPVDGKGFFYRPGILEDIPPESPAFREELFGPVALLFAVDNLDEAIELANSSRFGLGSAIFTNDENEISRAVRELDSGSTFVNAMVASDPRLPFGGVKASGYGRELSEDGIREFVNIKTVSIAT